MTGAAGTGTGATNCGILTMILAVYLFPAMDATAKGLIALYPLPPVVCARCVGQLPVVLICPGPRSLSALRTHHPV